MHNRISTLFELDALLAGTMPTGRHAPPPASPKAHAAPRPAPAKRQPQSSTVKSLTFDQGAPIVCEHDRPVTTASALALPPVLDLHAAYPFRVESFESGDEEGAPSAERPDPEGAAEDLNKRAAEATAGDDDSGDRARVSMRGDADVRQESDTVSRSEALAIGNPAYAAQLAAVERDLKDLAIRTQHPTPEEERASILGNPADDEPAAPPAPSPRSNRGHQVFDEMAKGMQYANTFALPAVEVRRTFDEMNRTLDARERADARAGADATRDAVLSAAKARVSTLSISDEELARDVAALTPPKTQEPLEAQASDDGHLKRFKAEELILSTTEAGRVIEWFWPDVKASELGGVTDTDRGFAQALLVEAIDASASMKIVEEVYKETYMKVFKDFDDVWEVVKTLAKKAYEEEWFTRARGKITRENLEHLTVYDSVKKTIARNFRSAIKIRVSTGEYVGY